MYDPAGGAKLQDKEQALRGSSGVGRQKAKGTTGHVPSTVDAPSSPWHHYLNQKGTQLRREAVSPLCKQLAFPPHQLVVGTGAASWPCIELRLELAEERFYPAT